MANATKATTALVAAALGLATVTATFVTVSSATSVADPAPVKIQDRMPSEIRLISIDDPTDTVITSDAGSNVTVAMRSAPVPAPAPRSASLDAPLTNAVPLPRAKPVELAGLAEVPLPQPRPQAEVIVGSLGSEGGTEMR
jgi:hypothetical protein